MLDELKQLLKIKQNQKQTFKVFFKKSPQNRPTNYLETTQTHKKTQMVKGVHKTFKFCPMIGWRVGWAIKNDQNRRQQIISVAL